MKLQQLRYFCEIVDQGLNVRKAAMALHISQPGVSRQIQMLEQELGATLLKRKGTRVAEITEIGLLLLPKMRQMLLDAEEIRRQAQERVSPKSERLIIATTHSHARYVLPKVFKHFINRYPNIVLGMRQVSPSGILSLLKSGEVDIGLSNARVTKDALAGIRMIPCYPVGQTLVMPPNHPLLLKKRPIQLADLLPYPMIGLQEKSSVSDAVREKFEQNKMQPNIVMRASDPDVVKAYVDSGFGIAVIKNVAFSKAADKQLKAISVTHLFGEIVSYAMLLKRRPLERYMNDFISMLQAQSGNKSIK